MRPLTDAQFVRLVPLAAGMISFGGTDREYGPLVRRGLAVCGEHKTYTATPAGRALVSQQITRLIVLRSAGVWHGIRRIK